MPLNRCTIFEEAVQNVVVTAGLVALAQYGGRYVTLLVLGLELVRWLRLRLLRAPLVGKVALITGGAMGLGRKMAEKIVAKGGKVILWDMNEKALEETRAAIGEACIGTCVVDVTNKDKVYAAAKDTGRVDILINNAGVVSAVPFPQVDDVLIERTMNVNTMALFWMTKAFLPAMVERKSGAVVTVASQAGQIGVSGLTDYSASKFAAIGFAESLRMEMMGKSTGVHVMTVNPFYINTGMFDGAKSAIPALLPMLDADNVADRIVGALQSGEQVVNLPAFTNLVPLTRMVPVSFYTWFMGVIGIHNSMDQFHGRAIKKKDE